LEIVQQALLRFEIDLHFLFYDLTAFVMHGAYAQSALVDYGFAHNTPSDTQKVKVGLNVSGDGAIPTDYQPWSGRSADLATVQYNMERLCQLLARRGWPLQDVLVIGDRANLNDELALAYDAKGLKYLAGLKAQTTEHRELLRALPEQQFEQYPLGTAGYWGWPCQLTFTHNGQSVTHRGVVILSGPMRHAWRTERAAQLRALRAQLAGVQSKIGQKRYRSVKDLQARADTCVRRSPVGKFMRAEASVTRDGQLSLRCWVDRQLLWQAMQSDGRYLLATNDWSLSTARMLELYRSKDGIEKRFEVAKQDLKVSPLYVHSDERIEAMLLLNMLALLVYSLLEGQVQRHGLQLTTRRIIEQLDSLAVIETQCWDGSVLARLTPINDAQAQLLEALDQIIAALLIPPSWTALTPPRQPLTLSPPVPRVGVGC
jgi:transposase